MSDTMGPMGCMAKGAIALPPPVFGCAIFSAVVIIISSNLFHCTSYQITSVRIMEIYRDGRGRGGGGATKWKKRGSETFLRPPPPFHYRVNIFVQTCKNTHELGCCISNDTFTNRVCGSLIVIRVGYGVSKRRGRANMKFSNLRFLA